MHLLLSSVLHCLDTVDDVVIVVDKNVFTYDNGHGLQCGDPGLLSSPSDHWSPPGPGGAGGRCCCVLLQVHLPLSTHQHSVMVQRGSQAEMMIILLITDHWYDSLQWSQYHHLWCQSARWWSQSPFVTDQSLWCREILVSGHCSGGGQCPEQVSSPHCPPVSDKTSHLWQTSPHPGHTRSLVYIL